MHTTQETVFGLYIYISQLSGGSLHLGLSSQLVQATRHLGLSSQLTRLHDTWGSPLN